VLFARSKGLVGLDIGSSTLKLVELKERKGEFSLVRLGVESLSPEAIVDGSIMDSSLVVDAIRRLNEATGVKAERFATSLSGHSVIIKKISMPAMPEEDLAEPIQWEAEQYIPFDIKDVNVDVQILNPKASHGQMDVLLVAAKKDVINDYTSVVSEAGLVPVCVDVDTFCVQNMFELNYGFPANETIALINIGASVININVISNGITTFTRDIAFPSRAPSASSGVSRATGCTPTRSGRSCAR